MVTQDLYIIAEKNRVPVYSVDLPLNKSMSMRDDEGNCFIGIDRKQLNGNADEKIKMAHEIGHCMTGSFYSRHIMLDIRDKHEYRADKWAVHRLIPFHKLKSAFKRGCVEVWELAEYFEVTEGFIKRALYIYGIEGLYTPPQSEL